MQLRNRNGTVVESAAHPRQSPESAPQLRTGKFSTILVAVYVFVVASRILDLSWIAKLHIPLMIFIALALFTLGMISQRGIHGFLDNKASFCFAALTVWVVLAYPLSEWRAESWRYMQSTVQGLVIFAAVVLVASTPENWRRIAAAFGYATLTAAILSFFISRMVGNRMTMGRGSLADPNEFALALVIGLPFLLYTASVSKGTKRMALYAGSVLLIYAFARAGSRGGLLAFLALLLVLFILAKSGQKLLMIVVCLIGLAGAAVVLPGYIKTRFTTFFAVHNNDLSQRVENRLDSDVASTEARKDLLIQSLHITAQHPFLGVGPGVFPTVARHQRVAEGKTGGSNLVTHNTYTEYSSECGVLAFIFWAGTLYFCIKYALQAYRSSSGADEGLATASRDALAAMMALAVGCTFLSLAYGLKIPLLLGLVVALRNVAQAQRANPRIPENAWASAAPQFAPRVRPQVLDTAAAIPPGRPRRFDLSGRPRSR